MVIFLPLMNRINLLIAFLFDILFGDPPNQVHPVAWMGNLIAWLREKAPRTGDRDKFIYGAGITLGGCALVAGIGEILSRLARRAPFPINVLVEGVALKSTFSWRGLDRAAGDVQQALEANNLPEARRLVSWHLVSRDTSALDESQVAAATIESVAENASDGIIAPLFYYAVGGLPAALAYRYANTADAMLGYRDEEREWLGKFPARFDDLLNFIPARLTGLLITLAARLIGDKNNQSLAIMQRDAHLTNSPNAGYPMAAMAGALGVELEKDGQYTLGAGLRTPGSDDIQSSRQLLALSIGLGAVVIGFLVSRTTDE